MALLNEVSQKAMKIVWFGGFPAHYMSNFHVLIESKFCGVFFLYVPLGKRGSEFSHEYTMLPHDSLVLRSSWSVIQAWRILNRLNAKAILIAGNYPRINLVAAIWARYNKRELFYLSDSNILDLKNISRNIFNQFFLKKLLQSTSKLLSIGSRNKEFYIKVCGIDFALPRLHHFPLPHSAELFEGCPQKSEPILTFLLLGRLVQVKAVDHVLYAFSGLSKEDQKKSRILIAGDGPLKSYLENLAQTLGIGDRVEFLGSIPSTNTPDIYAKADVVLVPSHQEPWGLVINEALSSGRPVIAPPWVGSSVDLVKNQETGLIVTDNSPVSIRGAMKYCLDHPHNVKKMGLSGRALVRDGGWTVDRAIDSFENLIRLLN